MELIILILWICLSIPLIAYVFYKLVFLRDPKRKIPSGNNIISPADGKIVSIVEINNNKIKGIKIKKGLVGKIFTSTADIAKDCYVISIFMGLLDVHVNRAPIAGKIENIKYKRGKFFPANTLKNGLINEKNEITIKNKKLGKIKIIQIAGFLARRIECWVNKNKELIKGQKVGRINLGSQVTMVLPKNIKLKIKKGDKVKGGSTIIAEY